MLIKKAMTLLSVFLQIITKLHYGHVHLKGILKGCKQLSFFICKKIVSQNHQLKIDQKTGDIFNKFKKIFSMWHTSIYLIRKEMC